MTRLAAALLAIALGVLTAPTATAGSLTEAVERAATTYHEDGQQLDRARGRAEQAARERDDAEVWLAVARVSFVWAEARAATRNEKLAAYDRGRQAAAKAIERAPRSAVAHFWLGINTARWGQLRGVLQSLALVPTLTRAIETALSLDPALTATYALAGHVYVELPRVLGGDLDRAETMFRTGIAQDPHFTAMRVGLATVLARRGRTAEARREATAVLDERVPSNRADWTTRDVPDARRLLDSLSP